MRINELIKVGVKRLKEKEIEEPVLKMRLLVASALNKNKEYIIAHGEDEIDSLKLEEIYSKMSKLEEYVPIQYITNKQEFMQLNFFVNENVLIPRGDTEVLVEEIIQNYKNEKVKILDLCTGSGCIAISLKKYIENSKIYAIDISEEALKVAKQNAINNEADITFLKSDIFSNIKEEKFDIIVSNPPYIKTEVINNLDKEVKKEPLIALDGGNDGLYFYKKIIEEGYKFLNENGTIFFEIGYDQKDEIINIVKNDTKYEVVKTKKDLGNNDRIIVIRKV